MGGLLVLGGPAAGDWVSGGPGVGGWVSGAPVEGGGVSGAPDAGGRGGGSFGGSPGGTEDGPGVGRGLGLPFGRRHGSVGGAFGEETRQAVQGGNDDPDDPRAERDPFAEAAEGLAELIEFTGCSPGSRRGDRGRP